MSTSFPVCTDETLANLRQACQEIAQSLSAKYVFFKSQAQKYPDQVSLTHIQKLVALRDVSIKMRHVIEALNSDPAVIDIKEKSALDAKRDSLFFYQNNSAVLARACRYILRIVNANIHLIRSHEQYDAIFHQNGVKANHEEVGKQLHLLISIRDAVQAIESTLTSSPTPDTVFQHEQLDFSRFSSLTNAYQINRVRCLAFIEMYEAEIEYRGARLSSERKEGYQVVIDRSKDALEFIEVLRDIERGGPTKKSWINKLLCSGLMNDEFFYNYGLRERIAKYDYLMLEDVVQEERKSSPKLA